MNVLLTMLPLKIIIVVVREQVYRHRTQFADLHGFRHQAEQTLFEGTVHHGAQERLFLYGDGRVWFEGDGDSAHQGGIFGATYELKERTLTSETSIVEGAPFVIDDFGKHFAYQAFQIGLLLLGLLL